MRKLTPLFCLLIGMFYACAQTHTEPNFTADSLRVVNAEWRTDSLDGFVLKRYHWGEGELFCAAQYVCMIEIPADSPRRLAFVTDTVLVEVSVLAERNGAVAAVNGSYFDMDLGNPICYLRINGQKWGENTPQKDDSVNRKYYQYASVMLESGRPLLLTPDSARNAEDAWSYSDVMTAGPMLLQNGQYVKQRDDRTFVTHRHNRTALGIRDDGTTVLVTVDGRFKNVSEGLTLYELERVMRWVGCVEAINLDGGGSTTMYVRDSESGVVNYPSDNRLHDHEGQRPVSNAIIVM